MSTKNRKLQVFVSSTFTDLRDERQAAVEAILSTGNIPAGMELFAAGDQSQMEVIKEWIRESDVYLLILGGRYGTIEPVSGKSYTHLEYEYALAIGKPHFAVVISENALNDKVKKHGLEMTERGSTEKYNEFKKLVTGAKLVGFWEDLKGIELAIHKSLSKFAKRDELIGWVRGDQAVNSGALAEELARLGKENGELRNEVERLRSLDLENTDAPSMEELYELLEAKTIGFNSVREYYSFNMGNEKWPPQDNGRCRGNVLLWSLKDRINGVYPAHPNHLDGFFNFLYHKQLIKFVSSAIMKNSTAAEFTPLGRKYIAELSKRMIYTK